MKRYEQFYTRKQVTRFEKDILEDKEQNVLQKVQEDVAKLTNRSYSPGTIPVGSIIVIFFDSDVIEARREKEKKKLSCELGDVVVISSQFRSDWDIKLPTVALHLYEQNYMSKLYLSINERLSFRQKVRQKVALIHSLPEWKQCIQKCLDLEFVGSGCYGNVFKTTIEGCSFAVKISKLKPEACKKVRDLSINSWHEQYFLQDVIQPIIEKRICPNLPLLFDQFVCDNCIIQIDDEKTNVHSVITLIELANSDLKKYLQTSRTEIEIMSALFQIMAGLHAIQMNGQIMNFDIKKENVLCYDVVAGGVWQYTINGIDYYVPNCGKLFILNDFGISRTMSPDYPLYRDGWHRLGSRYGIIMNDKIIPIEGGEKKVKWNSKKKTKGTEFRMNKKGKVQSVNVSINKEAIEFLKKNRIPFDVNNLEFYRHPMIIPPFEFYNDTQDVIRMFVGGKRTTQKGNHRCYPSIPKKLVRELKSYIGKGESMKTGIFRNAEEILAVKFIEKFFQSFRVKKGGEEVIERYLC